MEERKVKSRVRECEVANAVNLNTNKDIKNEPTKMRKKISKMRSEEPRGMLRRSLKSWLVALNQPSLQSIPK